MEETERQPERVEPEEEVSKEHAFDVGPKVEPLPNNDVVLVGGKHYWKDTGILITRRDIRAARKRAKHKKPTK